MYCKWGKRMHCMSLRKPHQIDRHLAALYYHQPLCQHQPPAPIHLPKDSGRQGPNQTCYQRGQQLRFPNKGPTRISGSQDMANSLCAEQTASRCRNDSCQQHLARRSWVAIHEGCIREHLSSHTAGLLRWWIYFTDPAARPCGPWTTSKKR